MSIQTRLLEMAELLRDIDTSKLMDVRQRCVAMKALTDSSNPNLGLWTPDEIQFQFRAHAEILRQDLIILKQQLQDAKDKMSMVSDMATSVKTDIAKIAKDTSGVIINYQADANQGLSAADSAMSPVRELIAQQTENSFKSET